MILFADIADVIKKKYKTRVFVNTNSKEITLFEEGTGRVFVLTLTEKKFAGPGQS